MSSKTPKEITPFTVLLNAAHVGKLKRLKKFAALLDDGKGIARTVSSIKDEDGRGALHFAASRGNLNICKYLIEELKLDVDVKDGTGETPLARATIEGRLSTVEYLLEKGANPEISDDENVTPLHCAAMRGHKEIITLLLSRGINVDVINDFGTPLQYAVATGNHEAVKVLLDYHANPNLFFHHTFTPLQASMFSRSWQCTELLIKAGVDPDGGPSGVKPLVLAASDGLNEIIKCLVKAGADPNVTDIHGLKPVEIAAVRGNRRGVAILFPVTSRIPTYVDWSINGIMRHANSDKFEEQMILGAKEKFLEAKSRGTNAFQRKEYWLAVYWYSEANNIDPHDAAVLSNRSMSYAHMKKGDLALDDASQCISLRPDWPKAYYRAGVALNILKRYGDAADAFFEGLKLDPQSKELEDAFREAAEARLKSINVK
ncbi:Tetratricopeptide TPR-1 [Macleaya cordata]|uniref:Tetratricopeptide TPR-1 n=1 Tax=Macleaya cordata TaxID=56857 RepID=A0A200Q876_MACCD|nr:Tetratricopeptide TPR-1 [Macleaya cordata]